MLVMASWCLGPNLKDIDKPVLKDDEVLVRVHAASVHPDVRCRRVSGRGHRLARLSP